MSHIFHKINLGAVFFLCASVSLGQEPLPPEATGYSALLEQSGEGTVTVGQGIENAIQKLLARSNSATQKAICAALVITKEAKEVRSDNIQPLEVSAAWTILESFHYFCELLNLNLECIDGKIKINSIQQKIDSVRDNHAVLINTDVHSLLTGLVKFDMKVFKEGRYFDLYYEAFKGMNMQLKDLALERGIIFYEASSESQRKFTLLLEQYINNKQRRIKQQ